MESKARQAAPLLVIIIAGVASIATSRLEPRADTNAPGPEFELTDEKPKTSYHVQITYKEGSVPEGSFPIENFSVEIEVTNMEETITPRVTGFLSAYEKESPNLSGSFETVIVQSREAFQLVTEERNSNCANGTCLKEFLVRFEKHGQGAVKVSWSTFASIALRGEKASLNEETELAIAIQEATWD